MSGRSFWSSGAWQYESVAMSWEFDLIDSVCEPADDDTNEDGFGYTDALAWVIDGASPLSTRRVAESADTDAEWIAKVLDEALSGMHAADTPPVEALRTSIAAVEERSEEWTSVPEIPPSAALGVIRAVGPDAIEYAILADVTLAVKTADDIVVISDSRADDGNQEAMARLAELLTEGADFHEAMREVRPLLLKRRITGMNKPGGYWVAATDPSAADEALAGTITGVESIILASDGFARGVDLYGLWPSWQAILEDESESLLSRYYDLREFETTDPDCRQFPRWSREDDATAARFKISTAER